MREARSIRKAKVTEESPAAAVGSMDPLSASLRKPHSS